jgi:membrane-bound lytic murein transglycosylase F
VVIIHSGPLTYDTKGDPDDPEEETARMPAGFEHDLVRMFAEEWGIPVRFVVVPRHEVRRRLARHEGHLAASWLSPVPSDKRFLASEPLLETRDVLVRHEAALSIRDLEQLAGQTVYVNRGGRQFHILEELKKTRLPDLRIAIFPSDSPLDLLQAVARREVEIALVDQAALSLGLNYFPMLEGGMEIGPPMPIVWLFPADGDPQVRERAGKFIAEVKARQTLAKLRDRYMGHLERLRPTDIMAFLARMENRLPRYQKFFQEAQQETAIDWRLLAALSYQESHWDPLNTSYTGVRGIMMLTEATADRMGVSNRLDPVESIRAGARYLSLLKSYIPESTPEPDRTWQAIAAYNLGPGHFNAARRLAGRQGVDGDSWFEMKRILPLLARPEYYQRLKSGRARGGEAVIMVENIRLFYDILLRYQSPLQAAQNEQDEEIAG